MKHRLLSFATCLFMLGLSLGSHAQMIVTGKLQSAKDKQPIPFANIATVDNTDALLVMDRLSPLLACLPLIGFPLGYLTGPRSRAMVHGDISSSNKRVQRKQKKALKARQARTAKKNELI